MIDFDDTGCVLVKGFLDLQAVQTVSRYMEYALKQNAMPRHEDGNAPSYARYADPLMETILFNSKEHVESITKKTLHPTYSFSRVYVKGDVLKPHVDRESCEISVTVHVAAIGKPWHIWMKPRGKEPMSFELEPGDAVVYKGCEVVHWREKAVDTDLNAQFMLHYVDQNGPYAEFKLDKRASLGVQARGI
jgi:alkylated DNA repair dioxygenase AlkB